MTHRKDLVACADTEPLSSVVNKIIESITDNIPIKILICLENFSTLIVSGDFSSSVVLILLAIFPISVLLQVRYCLFFLK